MPFVDDDAFQVRKFFTGSGMGEEEGKGFGGGDEAIGKFFTELGFAVRTGVAGSGFDGPIEIEIREGLAEGLQGIVGKSAQRSKPKDLAALWVFVGVEGFGNRAEPDREGFAETGGSMKEPGFLRVKSVPNIFLKLKGFPFFQLEPFSELGVKGSHFAGGRQGEGSSNGEKGELSYSTNFLTVGFALLACRPRRDG